MKRANFFLILTAIIIAIIMGGDYFIYRQKLKTAHLRDLYILTEKDPLFYSPNFDSKKLRESIDGLRLQEDTLRNYLAQKYLEEMRTRILKAESNSTSTDNPPTYFYDDYPKILFNSTPILFHPLDFLEKLPTVSEDTRLFLKIKSPEAGAKLLTDYEDAVNSYKKAIREQKRMFALLLENPIYRKASYVYLATATNLNIIIKDLKLIEKNAQALEEEVQNRKKCFWQGICNFNLDNVNSPINSGSTQRPAPQSIDTSSQKIIPDNLLETKGLKSPRIGPYGVNTICFGTRDKNKMGGRQLMYILLQTLPKPGLKGEVFTPKLLTENFYYNLSYNRTIFGKTLAEIGIGYYFQPEGTNYLCPNLEYWGALSLAATGDELAYLPEMINAITNNLMALESQLSVESLSRPDTLLVFFSDYSISYFPFSNKFWRLQKHLQYAEKETPTPIVYTTYTDLRKSFNDEHIENFHFRPSDVRKEIIQKMEKMAGFDYLSRLSLIELIHRLDYLIHAQ